MKKMLKKSMSIVLTVMMVVLSFPCLMAQAAEPNNDQSVIYEFDDATVPGIFSIGNGGAVNIVDDALKVTTNAGKTESLKIDISDWAGAASKKGTLTYSFDYKPETDITTQIMVGSSSTSAGHIMAALRQTQLWGYSGDATQKANEWLNINSTDDGTSRVTLTFDLSKKTYSCSMGGKTVSHPFSYFEDKTSGGQTYNCEAADKFVLYFRAYSANEYNYYIDNFKAEYTESENISYDFYKNTDVPSVFSMVGNGGAVNIENDALKVTTNAGKTDSLKIDISDWAAASSKKDILKYSFDYMPEADGVSTQIMIGSSSTAAGYTLAALRKTQLMDYTGDQTQKVKEALSIDDTDSPYRVTLAFDFSQKTYSCSMGGQTVTHPFDYFADKTGGESFEDADKFVLYFRTYSTNEYSYLIDNFKAEYTDRFTVSEFAFDNTAVTAGATLTVNYDVTNNLTSNDKLMLVLGVFDGGKLINCNVATLEFTPSNTIAKDTLEITVPESDSTELSVQAFLWDYYTLKPYAKPLIRSGETNVEVLLNNQKYASAFDNPIAMKKDGQTYLSVDFFQK